MKTSAHFLVTVVAVAVMLSACATPATSVPPTSAPPAAPTTAPAQPTVAPTAPPPTKAPTPTPKPKMITVARNANDPKSIDPQRAVDARDAELETQLFAPLVAPNVETNEIMPGMAKSWDISSDGLVYTFHLIDKVPWVRYNPDTKAVEQVKDKDGNVRYVTAQDFVYGFLRTLNPDTAANEAYVLAPYIVGGNDYNNKKGPADKVALKAVDDTTFQITAPEKIGYALGIYSILHERAVPQWAIEANGDAWTDPKNINTYGPFALKEWAHESSMTLVKNPFWPGAKGIQQPKLDQVTFRFIDAAPGLTEFEAGNLDEAQIPTDQVVRIAADSKLGPQLKVVPGQCTQAWNFNTQKAPFNNVHIRRAFNFAVDRVSLVKDVLAGGQIPAGFFTPPSVALAPSALPEFADLGTKMFDPEKAKQELALGLKDLGLASADKLPSITVEFGTGTELTAVSQALQAMWQKTLGIKVQLSQIDNKVYWGKQGKDAGQIHRAGWCPDYNDANNYLLDVYRSDSGNNFGKWNNPQFDKLVDQARVEADTATRLKLYTQAEQILNIDDAGTMTLYYPVTASLTKPNIKRTYTLIGMDYYWDWDITQ
jgi:oligopeptide transport system substrate-binding protein